MAGEIIHDALQRDVCRGTGNLLLHAAASSLCLFSLQSQIALHGGMDGILWLGIDDNIAWYII